MIQPESPIQILGPPPPGLGPAADGRWGGGEGGRGPMWAINCA